MTPCIADRRRSRMPRAAGSAGALARSGCGAGAGRRRPAGVAQETDATPAPVGQVSVAFRYTGGAQTWTAPAGVTRASFAVFGAQGGAGERPGRKWRVGARRVGRDPRGVYHINVGGRGQDALQGNGTGGFNGGGNGGIAGFQMRASPPWRGRRSVRRALGRLPVGRAPARRRRRRRRRRPVRMTIAPSAATTGPRSGRRRHRWQRRQRVRFGGTGGGEGGQPDRGGIGGGPMSSQPDAHPGQAARGAPGCWRQLGRPVCRWWRWRRLLAVVAAALVGSTRPHPHLRQATEAPAGGRRQR